MTREEIVKALKPIADGQRVQLMHKSVQCGYEYADKIAEEYGTDDPVQIAKKMGMVVTYPEFPERTDRVLFAEFKPANQIRIYMDAVYKAKNLLRDRKTAEILTDKLDVSKLLLSHELFHLSRRNIRIQFLQEPRRSDSGNWGRFTMILF